LYLINTTALYAHTIIVLGEKMNKFVPIRDRLLVQKIEDELKTKTGLILSDDTKERPTKGTVLAVGDGAINDDGKLLPMVIKVGDTVVYPKYAGHPIKIDKVEYLILEEKEVLGTLTQGENNV
jgi:chaperonin GroES